jgi:parallel beta-helix repeat protein
MKLECEMKKLLVLGIIILFIGISLPTNGIEVENSSTVSFDGKTLYVGGSGPGNYTSIQSAIDDANPGDTVFVYDDSSPYIDYDIQINKSINLIGENRNTTVLNSWGDDVIEVSSDWVNISGFSMVDTATGVSTNETAKNIKISDNHFIDCRNGIYISNNVSFIISNKFENCDWGIYLQGDKVGYGINEIYIISNSFRNFSEIAIFIDFCFWGMENIMISDNIIISTSNKPLDEYFGDITFVGGNSKITNNTFIRSKSNNFRSGLQFIGRDNIIKGNIFSGYNNCYAFKLDQSSHDNIISYNNFTNNFCGILFEITSNYNKIINNNFINNIYDTRYFFFSFINHWDGNYWDEWIGHKFKLPIFQKLPKFIHYGLFPYAIDWHPAKEPYDIGV